MPKPLPIPPPERQSEADPDQAIRHEVEVAQVAVDMPLPHLDRLFDYAVPEPMREDAQPGIRVRVRFAGRLRDGYVIARVRLPAPERELSKLDKVVSSERVLTPAVAELVRAVADHYAGTFADVVRLAVPPRHAATEKAARPPAPDPDPTLAAGIENIWMHYPTGDGFLGAVRRGQTPRAFWQVLAAASPAGDWAGGLAQAAAAAAESGRGAIVIVPDTRDLARLQAACDRTLGEHAYVILTADIGPAARYRAFLAVLRGQVKVVIGTRAAAFAPVHNLGLVALWDDGDDLHAEPRAPYPHVREVLALRAAQTPAAFLLAAHARTCEAQQLLERGWVLPIALAARDQRRGAPAVRLAADSDFALERDPMARAARLPREVFEVIRTGLAQGPVLVQVPRAGYLVLLVCDECREPVRCPHCHGTLRARGNHIGCRWCGRPVTCWLCPECGSRRWRAPVVGAMRTAEELGKAFPNTPVVWSAADKVVDHVDATPALVIATPGGEPTAESAYAAAVLLDAPLLLNRIEMRAAEEALRRWLNAIALVRPGADQGTVIGVGPTNARALQALVRQDPAGFAARELAERGQIGLPPAGKLITVEGRTSAVADFGALLDTGDLPVQRLGPVELGPIPNSELILSRLTLRAPVSAARPLVAAVKAAVGVRSARKSEGALRVRVDPMVVD